MAKKVNSIIGFNLTIIKRDEKFLSMFLELPEKNVNEILKKSVIKTLDQMVIDKGLMTTYSGIWAKVTDMDKNPVLVITYRPSFQYDIYTEKSEIKDILNTLEPAEEEEI